jgi:hypothetical protein
MRKFLLRSLERLGYKGIYTKFLYTTQKEGGEEFEVYDFGLEVKRHVFFECKLLINTKKIIVTDPVIYSNGSVIDLNKSKLANYKIDFCRRWYAKKKFEDMLNAFKFLY